jgi:hypothetical protein
MAGRRRRRGLRISRSKSCRRVAAANCSRSANFFADRVREIGAARSGDIPVAVLEARSAKPIGAKERLRPAWRKRNSTLVGKPIGHALGLASSRVEDGGKSAAAPCGSNFSDPVRKIAQVIADQPVASGYILHHPAVFTGTLHKWFPEVIKSVFLSSPPNAQFVASSGEVGTKSMRRPLGERT